MKKKIQKRCALYCRVSTTDKQDTTSQVESLTAQAIRDGFKEKNITVYQEAYSGFKKRTERPKLHELLQIIEANPKFYEIIYLQELSRISRDPKEISDIFYDFVKLKQQVYIKSNNIFLLDENCEKSFIAGILIAILAELGKEEARVFKERSSRGLLSSAKSGRAGGGASIAYGYARDLNKMLVIDKEEAKIVKNIFQYYLDGYGGKLIANMLNDQGVKTRFAKTHPDKVIKFKGIHKTGSQVFFSDVVITSVLKNSLYCGKRNYKGEVLQAPAIISKEDFDAVQELMKTKRRESSTLSHPYLLKRVEMICGVCGRNFFGRYKPAKGGDCVYVCSSKYTRKGSCGNNSVNIDFFENVLLQFVMNDKSFEMMAGDKETKKANLKASIKKITDHLKLEEKALKSKVSEGVRIKEMYVNEIIGLTELKTMNDKLKKAVITIDANIKYLKQELESDNNQFQIAEKPIERKRLESMKSDRTFLRKYFEATFKKFIINGVSNKEILIKGQLTNNDEEFFLLLDRSALISRKGENLKYNLSFLRGGNNPVYLNNHLITPAEIVAELIKKGSSVGLGELKKNDMISIKAS